MKGLRTALTFAMAAMTCQAAYAHSAIDGIVGGGSTSGASRITQNLPTPPADTTGKLECVPYARSVSGIALQGDAYTWWKQARGRYARGHVPRVGAVMAIRPHGNSHLGHVAMVSEVVDSRTILLDHANWSYPGKVETNVTALDVSPKNDWSEVRIWYGPSQTLGASHWPVAGFIYNARPGITPASTDLAENETAPSSSEERAATRSIADPIGAIIAGHS